MGKVPAREEATVRHQQGSGTREGEEGVMEAQRVRGKRKRSRRAGRAAGAWLLLPAAWLTLDLMARSTPSSLVL